MEHEEEKEAGLKESAKSGKTKNARAGGRGMKNPMVQGNDAMAPRGASNNDSNIIFIVD